jgi:ABC-2 type transport system permease protein
MLLSVVAKYAKLSWRIFLANLSSALSFRTSFFLYFFGITLYFGGQFFLWAIFFKQFPMLGGWTAQDMILVYSLYIFSLSILDVFAGGVSDIAKIINAGNLDYYLAFPKPVLWHIAISKSDVASLGGVILSLVLFLSTSTLDPLRIALFLLASCICMILIFNFYTLIQSIAFFVGGFDQGARAFRHMLTTVTVYPFAIFPSPFKYLLMTFVPSFFIVTLPATLVDHFSFQTLAILITTCVVSSFAAQKVFTIGLKRYESGNMVNVRM